MESSFDMESSEKGYIVIPTRVERLPLRQQHLQFSSSVFILRLRKCMVKTTSLKKIMSLGCSPVVQCLPSVEEILW